MFCVCFLIIPPRHLSLWHLRLPPKKTEQCKQGHKTLRSKYILCAVAPVTTHTKSLLLFSFFRVLVLPCFPKCLFGGSASCRGLRKQSLPLRSPFISLFSLSVLLLRSDCVQALHVCRGRCGGDQERRSAEQPKIGSFIKRARTRAGTLKAMPQQVHWLFLSREKQLSAPKGLPRRSSTPVLTGPCAV